jgi:hypothetical protein
VADPPRRCLTIADGWPATVTDSHLVVATAGGRLGIEMLELARLDA